MNFMYGNARVKESLTKEGLADVMHKLWTWISLNKTVLISALKLLATFTTKCNIGKAKFKRIWRSIIVAGCIICSKVFCCIYEII
jgi:hypothetical protein